LIDWCLTPTLAEFQLHSGISLFRIPVYTCFTVYVLSNPCQNDKALQDTNKSK